MENDKYRMSFTTGGLFLLESVKLATLYLELGDWPAVRRFVIDNNVLQVRTQSALTRIFREIASRLETLSFEEMRLLVNGNHQEQAGLLWISTCRRYRLIADFATEVIRERFLSLQTQLSLEEFDSFFNRKAEWHGEMEAVTRQTRNKLRQVLFKILREADLLSADFLINATILSPRLLEMIRRNRPGDLLFFPIFESDLKGTPL